MPRKKSVAGQHTGQSDKGHTRDVKVERVGAVTIYKRGATYYVYYRESGRSERRRVDGNLAAARATAAKVANALGESRPSPLGFQRTSPRELVDGFLDYVAKVKKLAWRTEDRYRAALDRLLDFCAAAQIDAIDRMDQKSIEDFVRWLRSQTRTRNGANHGKRDVYKLGGIKFILSTCRTAFNWAARRRFLPPYAENPFCQFPTDELHDPLQEDEGQRVFTPEQERAFFEACSTWQRGIFVTLATYGLRAGELTHLLVEDVDLPGGTFHIRSKPEMFWRVKTARRRQLPLTANLRSLFQELIGDRTAGFVFLNRQFALGEESPRPLFARPEALRGHLKQIVEIPSNDNSPVSEREKRRRVVKACRKMGQIPVKRLQSEFMAVTKTIGCPEFTRTHDLRHLFSSRAQEVGVNPLLVQQMLGHTTLDMTKRYTHLGMDTKREALERLTSAGQISPQPEGST